MRRVGLPATEGSPDLAGPEDPRELPASPVHHSIKSTAGVGLVCSGPLNLPPANGCAGVPTTPVWSGAPQK
jgi:hypothetical protein